MHVLATLMCSEDSFFKRKHQKHIIVLIERCMTDEMLTKLFSATKASIFCWFNSSGRSFSDSSIFTAVRKQLYYHYWQRWQGDSPIQHHNTHVCNILQEAVNDLSDRDVSRLIYQWPELNFTTKFRVLLI